MFESEVLQEDDILVSIDIEEFLEDNEVCALDATVEVSGKIVRKAGAAREILNENEYVIADKLDSTNDNEVELDEMIMIGNKVCGKMVLKSCFAVGKIASIKDIKIMKSRIRQLRSWLIYNSS